MCLKKGGTRKRAPYKGCIRTYVLRRGIRDRPQIHDQCGGPTTPHGCYYAHDGHHGCGLNRGVVRAHDGHHCCGRHCDVVRAHDWSPRDEEAQLREPPQRHERALQCDDALLNDAHLPLRDHVLRGYAPLPSDVHGLVHDSGHAHPHLISDNDALKRVHHALHASAYAHGFRAHVRGLSDPAADDASSSHACAPQRNAHEDCDDDGCRGVNVHAHFHR